VSAFAQIKHDARRAVHDALSVEVVYTGPDGLTTETLSVRWHNRINRHGDLDVQGYAEIVENIDRVIFDLEELAAKGVTLAREGSITLPEIMGGATFSLDTQEPDSGPIERIWLVTRDV
jgi:hypothetical protein